MMQRSIILVLGKQGAGKSTLLFNRIVPLCSAPCFILDTMGDVGFGVQYETTEELVNDYFDGENWSGVYVLKAENNDESSTFFRCVYEICKDRAKKGQGRATLVVDEVDKFCSSFSIDETLDHVVRYGRRHGMNLICAARRTVEVHTQIRAQADCIISLFQDHPKDIKALQERDPNAYIVGTLNTFRKSGQESEFICVGDFPIEFQSLNSVKAFRNHEQ